VVRGLGVLNSSTTHNFEFEISYSLFVMKQLCGN